MFTSIFFIPAHRPLFIIFAASILCTNIGLAPHAWSQTDEKSLISNSNGIQTFAGEVKQAFDALEQEARQLKDIESLPNEISYEGLLLREKLLGEKLGHQLIALSRLESAMNDAKLDIENDSQKQLEDLKEFEKLASEIRGTINLALILANRANAIRSSKSTVKYFKFNSAFLDLPLSLGMALLSFWALNEYDGGKHYWRGGTRFFFGSLSAVSGVGTVITAIKSYLGIKGQAPPMQIKQPQLIAKTKDLLGSLFMSPAMKAFFEPFLLTIKDDRRSVPSLPWLNRNREKWLIEVQQVVRQKLECQRLLNPSTTPPKGSSGTGSGEGV
ncbi:MAG: hypothetical protein AB1540_02845 [Bdellovibrionota bacterium]